MSDLTTIENITSLRKESDAQQRGYRFEQLIREILPWSHRPPMAVSTVTEQIDSFFHWNGTFYLVECKAKASRILAGSHDWEDFELKIRKRAGVCVGLFLSVGDVADEIYRTVEGLNKERVPTIILAGRDWDTLLEKKLPFSDFLSYMSFHARATFAARLPPAQKILDWCYDRAGILATIGELAQRESATFLRRHKIPEHESVFVPREIDRYLHSLAAALRPSRLAIKRKVRRKGDHRITTVRGAPTQTVVVKDFSGSGKTTLAVQVALQRSEYVGIAKAALEPDIDSVATALAQIGRNNGIRQLVQIDKPIVYCVDSLDEASTTPQKKKEVRALFDLLSHLYGDAISLDMIGFPLLLMFTVREDFWRDWESVFEGRDISYFNKRFSHFTAVEFDQALPAYEKAYKYHLVGQLDEKTQQILSHPFSLQVFSEALRFSGDVNAQKLLGHDALDLYFSRKQEEFLKRPVLGFYGDTAIRVCAELAQTMIEGGAPFIRREEATQVVKTRFPAFARSAGDVIKSITSEQILIRDPAAPDHLRFRHMRFVEYLIAYKIVAELLDESSVLQRVLAVARGTGESRNAARLIEEYTERLFYKRVVSLYHVHEFILSIARKRGDRILNKVMGYYIQSSAYIGALTAVRRFDLSAGRQTSGDDLTAIQKALPSSTPGVAWESFFVVAAKPNKAAIEEILSAFEIAWDKNPRRADRWKVLKKLAQHSLQTRGVVFDRVTRSVILQEWLTYLGTFDTLALAQEFQEMWQVAGGMNLLRRVMGGNVREWRDVLFCLGYLSTGRCYPVGERTDLKDFSE